MLASGVGENIFVTSGRRESFVMSMDSDLTSEISSIDAKRARNGSDFNTNKEILQGSLEKDEEIDLSY